MFDIFNEVFVKLAREFPGCPEEQIRCEIGQIIGLSGDGRHTPEAMIETYYNIIKQRLSEEMLSLRQGFLSSL